MPLSDDQKAMLRLLAQREQGYDDLAALMGLSVEEVRAKVREALDQLEAEGEASPVVPPPPEKPAAPEPPAPDPAPAASVESPPPEPETTARFEQAPKPPATPPHRAAPPRISLPADKGARAAILTGAAVVVVLVVLVATGALGGSSSSEPSTGAASATEAEEAASTTAASKQVTQAILSPVGGGSASGRAIFGRVKNSLALEIEAQGLAPTRQGQSYTVWLAQSPQKMLPLASVRVDKSDRIGAQVAVPTEVLAFLAKGTFDQIVVSLTSDATLKAALAKATSEKKAPIYTGADVLTGTVTGPIVGAAKKE